VADQSLHGPSSGITQGTDGVTLNLHITHNTRQNTGEQRVFTAAAPTTAVASVTLLLLLL